MSFSFSSLIRLLVLLALGSTMVAVGLSKLDPPRPDWRTRRTTQNFIINEYFIDAIDRTPRWLDAGTGSLTEVPLADGDLLDAASSSPWVEEQGRRQVIGRWSSRIKDGPMSISKDFGLARYTFPGGEVLDQVPTEIVPVGPPCWFPGTRARVIFAAGDGMLYHYAFESEDRDKAGSGRDARPIPLAWRCPKPGDGNIFLGDLTWPEDPRMGGCLIVSLRHQGIGVEDARSFSRMQLWWLKLNHAGTEVVETGRLVTTDVTGPSARQFDERTPTVSTLPDGRTVLAYLRQRGGEAGWELRVAPISIETGRQIPTVLESRSRVLAEKCQASHPAFSPDGRWLSAITGSTPADGRLARLRADKALAGPASPSTPPGPRASGDDLASSSMGR